MPVDLPVDESARRASRGLRDGCDRTAPRRPEDELPLAALDPIAAFVDEPVVAATKEHEIVDLRVSSVRPVPNVVRVDEPAVLAAGEAASAVARAKRTAHHGRHTRVFRPTESGTPFRSVIRTNDESHAIRSAVSVATEGPSSIAGGSPASTWTTTW